MTTNDDAVRAAALSELMVLDTSAEQMFDDIVFMAARACDAPIALVSLLDTDRQWFKARTGLDVCETDIDQSVCRIGIDQPALLEIRDLIADERTRDNPLVVGERAFRFYAGAPIVLRSGIVVGRLCVIDMKPRPEGLSDPNKELLCALGRQAGEQLELRRIAASSDRLAELQASLVEVGERIRASTGAEQMAMATAEIVGRTLAADRVGYGSVDAAVEIINIEPDWTAPGVTSVAGRHRFDDYGTLRGPLSDGLPIVIEDVLDDPRTSADSAPLIGLGVRALVNMPVRERGQTVAIFFVHSAAPRRWLPEERDFLRTVADRLEAGVSRHRAEERQRILNGEISHRMKNMLTMVQAIASQTLRAATDRDAVKNFERRLMALSAAQDVLFRESWSRADLRAVAEKVVADVGYEDQVRMDGPRQMLGPRAALSFSLIMHELLTNAIKYGALSVADGYVELSWSVESRDSDERLIVRWRERNGPVVKPPTRPGFGSRLVRAGLVGTGGVDLRYDPDGFAADLQASVPHLAQA